MADAEVAHSNGDADADSGHGTAIPDEEAEGYGEESHDEGKSGNGELSIVLHLELDRIETTVLQILQVLAEFCVVHLAVLLDGDQEVVRVLGDLREGGDCEVIDGAFVDATHIACSSLFPDPLVNVFLPAGATRADLAGETECLWVDLEHPGFDHGLLGSVEAP